MLSENIVKEKSMFVMNFYFFVYIFSLYFVDFFVFLLEILYKLVNFFKSQTKEIYF